MERLNVLVERVTPRFHRLTPDAGARLIFVGDIHGCYDETVELLRLLDPRPRDVVVSVGDIVRKGPAPARCLDLWRESGYLAVLGNNETRLLERARPILRFFEREDRDVLRRDDLLRWLRSRPLVIDIPAERIAVVHGGFFPGTSVTAEAVERARRDVVKLRWIRRKGGEWARVGKNRQKKDDVLWAAKWQGERLVVYGHTPVREPKFDASALGLDTGCVYGGSLTAAVYERGAWRTVSVPAKQQYAQ